MRTETIFCDNAEFTVHEMNMVDVRNWISSFDTGGPCDLVGELAIEDISLKDLALVCHCEAKDFDQLTARELQMVADMAKEVNPHFFRVRKTLRKTAEFLAREQEAGRLPEFGVSA